jgi:hypothetical protein
MGGLFWGKEKSTNFFMFLVVLMKVQWSGWLPVNPSMRGKKHSFFTLPNAATMPFASSSSVIICHPPWPP